MNTFLLRASSTAVTPGVQVGLRALKKLRPSGTIGVYPYATPGSAYTRGLFDYTFTAEGKKIDATIQVDVGEFRGKGKGLIYDFSFVRFALLPGGKARMFHPEADKGPMLTSLNSLGKELTEWETIVAKGLKP